MDALDERSPPGHTGIAAPTASIVVTGYRDAPLLAGCLRSIIRNRPNLPFEVIVFLNEPSSGVEATAAAVLPEAQIRSSEVNVGFGGAVNRAVGDSSGEFVVILNDDAVVEPRWLDALVSAARAHERAGAIGSKVVDPDGVILEAGTVLWSDGTVTLIDDFSVPRPPPLTGVRRVDYASGVSLLVRRSSWDAVGGFDEGYFPAYCEDVDLCLKLQALGQEVLYEPASVVRHRQGASTPLPYRVFLRDRNTARLRARWPHALSHRLAAAPHDPRAISRAVQLAVERSPATGPGPQVPDIPGDHSADAAAHYLRRQLAVGEAYAAHLEAAIGVAGDAPYRQAVATTLSRAKPVLRRMVPGPYRAVARWWRRLTPRARGRSDAG
jgi:GT2 family glycosyltransferase